jgi:hypothetical protein
MQTNTPHDPMMVILDELRQLRADLKLSQRRLLTVRETANLLGIAEKSLRNQLGPRARNPFPVQPIRASGPVRFRLKDLDRYVDSLNEYEGKHHE